MATVRHSPCRGYLCIRTVAGDYCENCTAIRAQHAFSHIREGHSKPIIMCPPCEKQ